MTRNVDCKAVKSVLCSHFVTCVFFDSMEMSLRKLWETVKEGKPDLLQPKGSQS